MAKSKRETKGISLGVQTDPDLAKLAKELRAVDKKLGAELGKVNRRSANLIVDDARKRAVALGGVHKLAAKSIKPGGRATAIQIVADATGTRHPYAMVAFLGAKRRTGWNAHESRNAKTTDRYDPDDLSRRRRKLRTDSFAGEKGNRRKTSTFRRGSGNPQHPAWIGNQWEPGVGSYGKEPYAINPAIRSKLDEVLEFHGDAVSDLVDTVWRASGADDS